MGLSNEQLMSLLREIRASEAILNLILAALGGGSSSTETPSPIIRATGAGTIPANTRSFAVYNAGSANGTFNGGVIKPKENFNYSVSQNGALFPDAIAYDGTGTELVITYVT